jgi:hypothetical protein
MFKRFSSQKLLIEIIIIKVEVNQMVVITQNMMKILESLVNLNREFRELRHSSLETQVSIDI